MRLRPSSFACLALVAVVGCPADLPDPPRQCDATDGTGCLSDEICVDFQCVARPRCERDDDCPSAAFECVLPAPMEAILKEWDAGDGTGLAALRRLITTSAP